MYTGYASKDYQHTFVIVLGVDITTCLAENVCRTTEERGEVILQNVEFDLHVLQTLLTISSALMEPKLTT